MQTKAFYGIVLDFDIGDFLSSPLLLIHYKTLILRKPYL